MTAQKRDDGASYLAGAINKVVTVIFGKRSN